MSSMARCCGRKAVHKPGWLAVLALVLLTGCAPGGQPRSSSGVDPARVERQSRTLTMGVRYEPAALASKPLRESGSGVSSTTRLFNAELDMEDGKAAVRPYPAEAVPSVNSESWRVLPDGRMETSYRLKPNVTWHDGTALSAEDFAFAYRVFTAPTLGVPAG